MLMRKGLQDGMRNIIMEMERGIKLVWRAGGISSVSEDGWVYRKQSAWLG